MKNTKRNGLHSVATTCPHCGVRISNNYIYCGWSEVFGCHGVVRDWPVAGKGIEPGQSVQVFIPLSPQGRELLADIRKDQKGRG